MHLKPICRSDARYDGMSAFLANRAPEREIQGPSLWSPSLAVTGRAPIVDKVSWAENGPTIIGDPRENWRLAPFLPMNRGAAVCGAPAAARRRVSRPCPYPTRYGWVSDHSRAPGTSALPS